MQENTKVILDELLVRHKVQPVGKGYADCIIARENVADFVCAVQSLDIPVTGLTWWCHAQEDDPDGGCPHGMGGPKSQYHSGWFSELNFPLSTFNNSVQAVNYIANPKDEEILDCFVPALWLGVPQTWENTLGGVVQ